MIGYYAHKIANTLLTKFVSPLASTQTGPGLLAGSIGDFRFDRRFVFYFADSRLVHLGDQLFHQPLIELWRSGYELNVAVSGPFAPYFTSQGVRVISPDEYQSVAGAVIITKNDLAYDVAHRFPSGNYFVGVNYHLVQDPGPICYALARTVYDALTPLALDLPDLPGESSGVFTPYVPDGLIAEMREEKWVESITSDSGSKYLVYNDFVSSNHFAATRRMSVIAELARRRKAEGYKIVYTGSREEARKRPRPPDFVDVDLRGAFGPIGLYKLFSLDNVAGVISFDTFVMHVASAFRKDLYIVRKSVDYPAGYRRKYVPMYPGCDAIVKAYE